MARRRIPSKATRERWSKIPVVRCQGKCADACGPIATGDEELALVEEYGGRELRVQPGTLSCVFLKNGRCSVYSVRPTICRLWGVAEGMPCTFGCEPERVLSDKEAFALLGESIEDIEKANKRMYVRLGPDLHRYNDAVRALSETDLRRLNKTAKTLLERTE